MITITPALPCIKTPLPRRDGPIPATQRRKPALCCRSSSLSLRARATCFQPRACVRDPSGSEVSVIRDPPDVTPSGRHNGRRSESVHSRNEDRNDARRPTIKTQRTLDGAFSGTQEIHTIAPRTSEAVTRPASAIGAAGTGARDSSRRPSTSSSPPSRPRSAAGDTYAGAQPAYHRDDAPSRPSAPTPLSERCHHAARASG